MSIYLINQRFSEPALELAAVDDNAKVALIQDGVYLNISGLEGKKEVFFLQEDMEKRGIENIPTGARRINYGELIDLIIQEKVYNFI